MGRRSFLLLQGPVGPFFERLGQELRRRGHQVTRINLNGGDLVQWRLAGARNFRCAARDWPGYLDDLARRAGVSDLVTFGDCRPRHRIAARVMAQLGVRRHVFEEGYFRPDWITLERSGVNGYSGLPRDPAFYREEGALLLGRPWRPSQPVGPALRAMIGGALACYAGVAALRPWFAGHRSHRPYSAQLETLGWLERAVGLRARRRAAAARQQALLADPAPFFVLARQLDAAMQVRRHSPFAGMSSGDPDDGRRLRPLGAGGGLPRRQEPPARLRPDRPRPRAAACGARGRRRIARRLSRRRRSAVAARARRRARGGQQHRRPLGDPIAACRR